jgi:TNF receptor-associated factor 4
MASNEESNSEFDFVGKPSEEYLCPVTLEVLLDPVQTNSCCGNHLSRAAAQKLEAEGKPCPLCKKKPLRTTEDKFFRRKVRQLKVRCSNKSAGCDWVGELGELDNHLKPGSVERQCDFFNVECPLRCGGRIKRCNLKKYQSSKCNKRPFTCLYCEYKATHEKVVHVHLPKCQRYPKICPNECSTVKIERRFLQCHLQEECPLEKMQCEFSFAGCQAKVERKSMKEHLDNSKDDHLKLTASECKNLGNQLTNLMVALSKITPKPSFIPPPDIIMTHFERKQKDDESWFSPGFYTHIGGYKMCLKIDANGWAIGKGTHVSVFVYTMKGEFDSHLKWPFKGEITVELVNQKEGGVKYEKTPVKHTNPDERDEYFQRVTEGDRAEKGWGQKKFISHSDLYNPEEGKEYLVNDTLIFRVTNVEVTSV